jgi:hypothetical protein
MIVVCAAYFIALIAFLLIYFGIYRPLYSHPFPGDIVGNERNTSNVSSFLEIKCNLRRTLPRKSPDGP